MVTTRRKSARFQGEDDDGKDENTRLDNQIQEDDNETNEAKKKRKSSTSDSLKKQSKKKQDSETSSKPSAPPAIPVDVDILCYHQIDDALLKMIRQIYYSPKYECDNIEYRHVILPKQLHELIPADYLDCLLSEDEWRALGIRMSPGWNHYEIHGPEPHIFLFRRPIPM